MMMTDEHKAQLRTQRPALVTSINPEPLVEHLYSTGVIEAHHKQEIKVKLGSIQQSEALLDVIEGLNDWTFYSLLDSLIATEQIHVVHILLHGMYVLLFRTFNNKAPIRQKKYVSLALFSRK